MLLRGMGSAPGVLELEVHEAQDKAQHDVHASAQPEDAHVAHHVQEAAPRQVCGLDDPGRRVQASIIHLQATPAA